MARSACGCSRSSGRCAKDWACRLLKAHYLITSPNFIVMKAASEFKDKTTAINQLWKTDFTYLKIIGWGWYFGHWKSAVEAT